MNAPLYRIRDWNEHFENNRTRGLKHLKWVYFPNKHDGDGYTELMDHPDAVAHFGVWCLIVQVASRCFPRGTLIRSGGIPHDATSLARRTHITPEQFEAAIPRLLKCRWLEIVPASEISAPGPQQLEFSPVMEIRQVSAGIAQVSAPLLGSERSGSERKEGSGVEPATTAVNLYRKICEREPNIQQQLEIMSTVTDVALYQEVLIQFMLETRPAERVDWTLERYRERTLPPAEAADANQWESLTEAQQQQQMVRELGGGDKAPPRKDDVRAGVAPRVNLSDEVRGTGTK